MNKDIIIQGVETKQTSNGKTIIKIKDQDGKSYQLWPMKQDGTESQAYQFFKTLGPTVIGKTVEIFYNEQQGEFNGKPVTYRTIATIKPAPANFNQSTPPQVEAKQTEGVNWDKISWGKCKHAYLVEIFKANINRTDTLDLTAVEKGAEKWADMSMRKLNQPVNVEQ